MKQLFSCIVFLLGYSHLNAQITIESNKQMEVKIWGTDSLDRGFFILPNKSNYLLVGLTVRQSKGELTLSRMDKKLNILKERVYKSDGYQFCFAGTPAGKDQFILSGFTTSATSHRDAWILKVNDELDTIWTLRFGGEKNDQVYETLATRDGNFIAIGQTESWGNGDLDGLVIKFDGSGKVLWHKTVGGPKLDRTYSSIELDNGDLIVSGITNENYPGNSDILLLRLTSNGELVWQKTMGSAKGDIAHSMHRLKDNTFFTIGYTAEKTDTLSEPLIMHFNENGETIGKYTLSTGEDVKLINGFVAGDNQYIGTGFARNKLSTAWDVILSEFNFKTGKMTVKKAALSDQEECGYHIQPFDKDHVIIFGHTLAGHGDNLLIKWKR